MIQNSANTRGEKAKIIVIHYLQTLVIKIIYQVQISGTARGEVKWRELQPELQNYLRHYTLFWLKWPVHELVLPPPPLIKVANKIMLKTWRNNFEMEGRVEISISSHRCVTSSNLK